MFDNAFRKRYKNIPVAIHKIDDFVLNEEKKELTFLHFHHETEMMCILKGSALIYIDGTEYKVREGDCVLISPCLFHRGDINKGEFSYRCICFDTEIFGNELFSKIINTNQQLMPVVRSSCLTREICRICDLYEREEKGWELLSLSALYKIFGLIEKNGWQWGRLNIEKNIFCEKVIEYIKNNYKENITSKSCAESMFITQSCFCRKFRLYFAQSFSQYLCLYRLSKAKTLLEGGGATVTEAGERVGFNSTSYFIMQFKKTYQATPKQLCNM